MSKFDEELDNILKFLDGSQQLDGYWYGDTPTDRPKYWWRSKLREAVNNQRAEASQREATIVEEILNALIKEDAFDSNYSVKQLNKVLRQALERKSNS